MTLDVLDRLKPVVDNTIESLARTKFRIDPIGGKKYSRQTSIISSAYKRHGQILELAIRERLSESQYFDVWHEPRFIISDVADRAIQGRNSDIPDGSLIELPFGGSGRAIQVDAFVFDRRIATLRSYEIKRGNGHFDAGKKRSLLRDTLCTQALLRNYGKSKGYDASVCEAKVICYFGIRALPESICLIGDELDDHFVFSVSSHVNRVNNYFMERLYMLIESIGRDDALDFDGLCERCPLKVPSQPH